METWSKKIVFGDFFWYFRVAIFREIQAEISSIRISFLFLLIIVVFVVVSYSHHELILILINWALNLDWCLSKTGKSEKEMEFFVELSAEKAKNEHLNFDFNKIEVILNLWNKKKVKKIKNSLKIQKNA